MFHTICTSDSNWVDCGFHDLQSFFLDCDFLLLGGHNEKHRILINVTELGRKCDLFVSPIDNGGSLLRLMASETKEGKRKFLLRWIQKRATRDSFSTRTTTAEIDGFKRVSSDPNYGIESLR